METKRTIIAIVVGLGLMLLYFKGVQWLDEHDVWHRNKQTQSNLPVTSQPATAPATQSAVATNLPVATAPTTGPTIVAAPAVGAHVIPAATQPSLGPITVTIGTVLENDKQYTMGVTLRPNGASIDQIVLDDFKDRQNEKQRYSCQQVPQSRLDTSALASRNITVDGVTYDLAGVQWNLVSKDASQATYGADLVGGDGTTILHLVKTFRIQPRSDPSQGFEIQVDYAFENASGRELKIKTQFNGPVLPPPEQSRPPDRQVVAGYQEGKDSITIAYHPIEEYKLDKDGGQIDLTHDSKNRPAVWAGTESSYFAAVVLPRPVQGGSGSVDYIARILSEGINIDPNTEMENHQALVSFQTTELKLPARGSIILPLSVFVGPKWREVLNKPYYASYPREYNLLMAIVGSMCGWCTPQWLVSVIVALMTAMHWVLRDWGLAIIGLVAIVRLLLHPITRQSQISMSKMSKLGPEMERLKKKYADDKDALNKAMVEFHKQQGLGPYLGCLPMFLQMPIWIALYNVLQTTFELRQKPFLWNLTWIHDLSQPDYLIKFAHPITLFFTIDGLNLLPVLLAAVMVVQQKFMPKPVAATPEQEKQQKMMMWLSPILFLFFFYKLPSGLNLYIFTSTAVGIVESKVVRDHLKAREEAEKAGRVLVETKPTRGSKQFKGGPEPQARHGILSRLSAPLFNWWGKMLEHAEQVRQEQERRDKKKA